MSAINTMAAPQAPMNKLEAAFAGYLGAVANLAGSGSPLFRVSFYASQSSAKKTLPACIVWCEEATEKKVGSQVYYGRWFIYPWTQKDDDNAPGSTAVPEETQDARLAAIQAALRDKATMLAAVNYPGTGSRPVASFHLFDFHEAEDKHADRQRAFGEALCYEGGFAGYSVKTRVS